MNQRAIQRIARQEIKAEKAEDALHDAQIAAEYETQFNDWLKTQPKK